MAKPIHEEISDLLDSGVLQRARALAVHTWLKYAAEFDRISAEDPDGDPFENGFAEADLGEESAFLAAQRIHEAIMALETAAGVSDIPDLHDVSMPDNSEEVKEALNRFMDELESPRRRRRWSFDLPPAKSAR